MYPERRKRNIQLISDEERRKFQQKNNEDTWGRIEVEQDDDFEDLEEGEEIYLESDDEEVEVEEDDDDCLEEGEIEVDVEVQIERESKEGIATCFSDDSNVALKNDSPTIFMIDGKPFVPKQKKSKPTFAESHVRITTYLEKDIHMIVRMLLKQNQITSITALVNDSVKAYLLNEFSNDKNN